MSAVTLRDGSEAADPRLDRLVEFDERSRAYPITGLLTDAARTRPPRTRRWRCEARFDQGQQGACVLYSAAHEAVATPAPVKPAILTDRRLEAWYWQAQYDDEFPGGDYPNASPRMGGTSLLAGAKVMRDLGFWREFRWAFGIEDVVRGVGTSGPAWLGTWWLSDMWRPDSSGRVRIAGQRDGGHAWLMTGVDLRGVDSWLDGEGIAVNSWGPDWGDGGTFRFSLRELAALLEDQGEACFPTRRSTKPRLRAPTHWQPWAYETV